jgi:large repetitive protein
MFRPAGWLVVVALSALSLLVSGCPSGGGGGGGGSNEAPVAVDDVATTSEDTSVVIDVLANDTDEDIADLMFVVGFTEATNGTVLIDANGDVNYAPDPDFSGSDTFTYTITDGQETATASVAVTVSTVGDMPVTVADEYAATEDTVLTVSIAAGVLANDDDVDSPGFTAVLDNDASDGTVALAADGSFTYTPDADFSGADSFNYHATDGANDSSIVVVTITVAPVNDTPVADADGAYAVTEDVPLVVAVGAGVLAGDTDADADPLFAMIATPPSSGSVALNANGSFTYTPAPNAFGAGV